MTDNIHDDGGPAFPVPGSYNTAFEANGMSLRDWFAGQSIQTACAMTLNYMPISNPKFQENVAHHAYRIADAMLAARCAK